MYKKYKEYKIVFIIKEEQVIGVFENLGGRSQVEVVTNGLKEIVNLFQNLEGYIIRI